MNAGHFWLGLFFATLLVPGAGAVERAKTEPARPRSILLLPPINESTEFDAGYIVYAAAFKPLVERGYYVPSPLIVDRFLKENGLTVPGEMHQAPLGKLREVFGVDAVMYLVVHQFGTKYHLAASSSVVQLEARLVDSRTGEEIWTREISAGKLTGLNLGFASALSATLTSKIAYERRGRAALAANRLFAQSKKALPQGPLAAPGKN